MKKTIFALGAITVILNLAFSFLFWFLWNWAIPEIFNLPEISYLQAIAIFLICKILFSDNGIKLSEDK